jgi:hypothetical protein
MRPARLGPRKPQRRPTPVARARAFFTAVQRDPEGRRILGEQSHRIELDLTDGRPLHVEVRRGRASVKPGAVLPRRFDRSDIVHFRLSTRTLERLLDGAIRFTDALIPVDPRGRDALLLLECTLFKWSVLNWVGRLIRAGQTARQPRVARIQGGEADDA